MEKLNPMLNELRRQKQSTKDDQPRKKRCDIKVDIRVPISDEDRDFILWNARSKRQSMTKFCTEIVKTHIRMGYEFKKHPYQMSDFMVHVKADQELYQYIVNFSVEWDCSIREATHRILTDSIFYIRGGTHIEIVQ